MGRVGDAIRDLGVGVFRGSGPPWVWLVPGSAIFLAAFSTFCVTRGQALANGGDWVWVLSGVGLFILAGTIQALQAWAQHADGRAQGTEAERLRIAMKDALQPVAELIAAMPPETPGRREARLREVGQQAVGALCLLLKDVERLRAVVYRFNPATDSLETMAYHGRGSTPKPFVAGTARGDSALQLVRDGGSLFVQDLHNERPEQYGGSASDYATFISASINNGTDAYGMVTVDAPNAHDLVDTDKQIVLLLADLLAIAFAIADRPNSGGPR